MDPFGDMIERECNFDFFFFNITSDDLIFFFLNWKLTLILNLTRYCNLELSILT